MGHYACITKTTCLPNCLAKSLLYSFQAHNDLFDAFVFVSFVTCVCVYVCVNVCVCIYVFFINNVSYLAFYNTCIYFLIVLTHLRSCVNLLCKYLDTIMLPYFHTYVQHTYLHAYI